jgi:hypothetical protein
MDTRLSLSVRQLLILFLITVLVVLVLTILVFLIGQRSAIDLIAQTSPTQIYTPTMPPLPKAVTATPAVRSSERYIITEGQINQMVGETSDIGSPVDIQSVRISNGHVSMQGEINYESYQGDLVVSGVPRLIDSQIKFTLDEVTVDDVLVPRFLYPVVEEQINLYFQGLLSGYDIESIEVQEGQIVAVVTPW